MIELDRRRKWRLQTLALWCQSEVESRLWRHSSISDPLKFTIVAQLTVRIGLVTE